MPSQSSYYSIQLIPIKSPEDVDTCFQLLEEHSTDRRRLEVSVFPEVDQPPRAKQQARYNKIMDALDGLVMANLYPRSTPQYPVGSRQVLP